MDIGLPDISGIEVSKKLRAKENVGHLFGTPIVAITAYCLDDIRDNCLSAGINQLVSKPIHIDGFRKIILSTLRGVFLYE